MKRILILVILIFCISLEAKEDIQLSADRAIKNLLIDPQMGINVPVNNPESLFLNLWTVWKLTADEKLKISSLASEEKRKIIFRRYGLLENPYNEKLPMGFVKRGDQLSMNCLACHAGQVLGKTIIGLPNRNIDIQSLYHDIALLSPIGGAMLKIAGMSLGPERGIVNTFGMEQKSMLLRDEWMNLKAIPNNWGSFTNSITNTPPWWNLNYRTHLFADNIIPVTPRIFVSSATSPLDTGKNFRSFESDVADVFSLARVSHAPTYPMKINEVSSSRGKLVFEESCSRCHGHYENGVLVNFPNRTVSLASVETDPVRSTLTPSVQRALDFLSKGWVAESYKVPMNAPKGYLAPPLIGVWSTAPYLHNGSIPTLWDLLNPTSRPVLWKLDSNPDKYDLIKVGVVSEFQPKIKEADKEINTERSLYYDTRIKGHSKQGHTFADELSIEEKRDLLEYLKTL